MYICSIRFELAVWAVAIIWVTPEQCPNITSFEAILGYVDISTNKQITIKHITYLQCR